MSVRWLALPGLLLLAACGDSDATRVRLAYEHAGAIWTLSADGSDRRRVTRGPEDGSPAWSPDGSVIAFTRGTGKRDQLRGRRTSVWTVAPDGTGARELIGAGSGRLSWPVWSADGDRLAFVREELPGDDLRTTIEIADNDGANVRIVETALANKTTEVLETPAWSPDGNRLLYTRMKLNYDVRIVHSMALDGSDDRVLVPDGGAAEWSPDGKRLVYSDYRHRHHLGEACVEGSCDANGEIAIVNADGTGRRLLTSSEADDEWPHWSPDGTRILFSSGRNVPSSRRPSSTRSHPTGPA
jgi:Tol biopolymer transport system component